MFATISIYQHVPEHCLFRLHTKQPYVITQPLSLSPPPHRPTPLSYHYIFAGGHPIIPTLTFQTPEPFLSAMHNHPSHTLNTQKIAENPTPPHPKDSPHSPPLQITQILSIHRSCVSPMSTHSGHKHCCAYFPLCDTSDAPRAARMGDSSLKSAQLEVSPEWEIAPYLKVSTSHPISNCFLYSLHLLCAKCATQITEFE